MKVGLYPFTFALFLLSCRNSASPEPRGNTLLSEHGIILPSSAAARVVAQCTRHTPEDVKDFWTPSKEQIRELETLLPVEVESALSQVKWVSTPFRPVEYYRQYVGIIRGGRRLIYINAFHEGLLEGRVSEDLEDWRQHAVIVCDGGAGFFGVEYDPSTRQFGRIEFNDAVTGAVRE